MFLGLSGAPLVIVSLIAFIFILGLIVLIHEGGHFFFAKRAGILCHEFSIGMGPVLYKKKKGETTYSIRAFPIGGFVSMAGEEVSRDLIKVGNDIGVNLENDLISEIILDDNKECQIRGKVVDIDLYGEKDNKLYITLDYGNQQHYFDVKRDAIYVFEHNKTMQITPYDRSFESKKWIDRFLTIFAGPMMNFILAIIIYLIVSFATGVPNLSSNKIGEISKNYPAYDVLQVNDKIVSVNGNSVSSWDSFSDALDDEYKKYNTNIEIVVNRNGEEVKENIEVFTVINSIGISNIMDRTKFSKPDSINGLMLGTTAVRYKDKDKKTELKKRDIITKMKYGNNEVDIESWSQLEKIFSEEISTATSIYFEFYSYVDNGDDILDENDYVLKTYSDCGEIENYTNEVLSNQRIEKITHYLGVSPIMHFSFFGCIGQAFENFWNDFTLIFRTLKLLIAPSDVRQVGVSDLSGFVGIFQMVEMYIGAGFLALLAFSALLSVNIGVMNLLPIPALDGGRIAFLLYELITRKKPNKKVENIINNIFFILLMLLFVYVTFNDILRFF